MTNPVVRVFLRHALVHPSFSVLPEVLPQGREGLKFQIDWEELLSTHCKATGDLQTGSLLPLVLIDADPEPFMGRMPLLIHRLRMLRDWLYPEFPTLSPERLLGAGDVSGARRFHEVRCQIYRVLKLWKASTLSALKATFDTLIGPASIPSPPNLKGVSLINIQALLNAPEVPAPPMEIKPYVSLKLSDDEELGTLCRRERFGVVKVDSNFYVVSHMGVVRQCMLFEDVPPYLKGIDLTDNISRDERVMASFRIWLTSKVKHVTRPESAQAIFKRSAGLKDRAFDPALYTIVYRAALTPFAVKHSVSLSTRKAAAKTPKPRRTYQRRELHFKGLILLWRGGLWVRASSVNVSGVSPREVLMYNEDKRPVSTPKECKEAFFRPVVLMEREPLLRGDLELCLATYPDLKSWRADYIKQANKEKRQAAKRAFSLFEDAALLKYQAELRESTAAWSLLPNSHTTEEYRRRLDFLSYVISRFGLTLDQARDVELIERTLPRTMWIKYRKVAKNV